MRWRGVVRSADAFVRGAIVVALGVGVWAFLSRVLPVPAPHPAVWVLLFALGVVSTVVAWRSGWYARMYHGVESRAWAEEFPSDATARVRPGGAFEWHPRGEVRPGVRHGLVHRWWDAERGPRYQVTVVFEVPDEVEARTLLRATKRALASARRALPGRGKVRASAAHRDDPGPGSTVSARLAVQGIGADPSWARAASEAFAERFVREIGRAGHDASRTG